MFEGVPAEHFHQFIASPTPPSLPHSLSSFPLHGGSSTTTTSRPSPTTTTFPPFDTYPAHLPSPVHHPLHHHKHEEKGENTLLSTALDPRRERSAAKPTDPWSNDEVLALLRIRSSMESNWFPSDFTWENVSRKLAELGFKRTAEKCREKYEEESRYFTTINYCKNLRFFSDLEELYHGDHHHHQQQQQFQQQNQDPPTSTENTQNPSSDETEKVVEKSKIAKRRRGHDKRFEMLKSFCEDIVDKMLGQQELMHNKLLEDMMKRDEEMVTREEAWQKEEMDRVNKEIEIRAQEQAMAGDRQSIIIDLLNKFTSSSSSTTSRVSNYQSPNPPTSVSLSETLESHKNLHSTLAQKISIVPALDQASPNPKLQVIDQNSGSLETHNPLQSETPQNPNSLNTQNYPSPPTSCTQALATENSNSLNIQKNPLHPSSTKHKPLQNSSLTPNDREDLGKRWPRDEVLSLINLRCSLSNLNSDDKEGTKGPLWERISQGMLDLGYKRSAKRCKEKWENINKYFRKTKDVNKKRSLDSRTCPYFHQLSTLYSQGTLVAPSEPPENHSTSPENHRMTSPETLIGGGATMHATQGKRNVVQPPPFDLEF